MCRSYEEKGLVSKKHNCIIWSIHFTESCFAVKPRKLGHRLNKDAIPWVLPEFPKYIQKKSCWPKHGDKYWKISWPEDRMCCIWTAWIKYFQNCSRPLLWSVLVLLLSHICFWISHWDHWELFTLVQANLALNVIHNKLQQDTTLHNRTPLSIPNLCSS